jgi:phosphatidate phosphatase LPIN
VIPFNMKIGEAGEAFFVFETDAEVPEDLITSPILEPTRPSEQNAEIIAGKFGSREPASDGAAQEPEYFDLDAGAPSAQEPSSREEDVTTPTETRAGPGTGTGARAADDTASSSGSTAAAVLATVVDTVRPTNVINTSASFGKAVVHAVVETEREERERFADKLTAARNVARNISDARADAAIQEATGVHPSQGDEVLPMDLEKIDVPVEYRDGEC